MNCPKCNNPLREDMYCDTCKEYLFNMDKPKKGDITKSWLKIFCIALCCCILLCVLIMGICEIEERNRINKNISNQYDSIVAEVNEKNYDSALQDLKEFKEDYGDKNKKFLSKAVELENDIELKLYNDRTSQDMGISACKTYLEYYPDGKYSEDIKKSLSELSEKEALKKINNAKSYISQNDVLSADNELQSVINNSYISDSLKQQADELSKSISSKVADEKGKKLILGTWTKATGVQYIFEENGHMSMKLLSNYDASAGTILDGFEVKGLLNEINESGRILRGGLWEYNGIHTEDGKQIAQYTLFSQSSYHDCYILLDKQDRMGIRLKSGIGDMSLLFR